jgi:hypothetical protein
MISNIVYLFCTFLVFVNLQIQAFGYVTTDALLERIECIQTCHRVSHRRCHEPPATCGECLHSYEVIHGICQPKGSKLEFNKPEIILDVTTTSSKSNLVVKEIPLQSPEINLQVVDKKSGFADPNRAPSLTISNAVTKEPIMYSDLQILLIALLISICAAALVATIIAVLCYCCRTKEKLKTDEVAKYPPAYGTNDYEDSMRMPGDRKLAYSAQMYHYQHQKQQMLAMEQANEDEAKNGSGGNSDEEINDEHVVYECPGLAPSGELEVSNPYYTESPMPPYVNGESHPTNNNQPGP